MIPRKNGPLLRKSPFLCTSCFEKFFERKTLNIFRIFLRLLEVCVISKSTKVSEHEKEIVKHLIFDAPLGRFFIIKVRENKLQYCDISTKICLFAFKSSHIKVTSL